MPCYQCSQADIYSDGKIDLKDFSVLSGNWQNKGPLAGDITGNGTVDMVDLEIFASHWLEKCDKIPTIITQKVLGCLSKQQISQQSLASEQLPFNVIVQGNNIYFEDMISGIVVLTQFIRQWKWRTIGLQFTNMQKEHIACAL